MRCGRLLQIAILSSALAAAPATAYAYLDPGTGSMLVQSLLGALAAVLVFGRTAWARIKRIFRREGGKEPPGPPGSPGSPG